MRIFVDPSALAAGDLIVRGDEHHYLSHVRRARAGDTVELVDGEGRRASAVIASITSGATTLTVSEPEAIAAKPPFIRALVPLIKGDRMDICLEKLVEVGADEIVVFAAARSIVKLDADRKDTRLAKFEAALQAAARQSGRAQVPRIRIADSLAAALEPDGLSRATSSMRIALDPTSDAPLHVGDVGEVTIASGPEGGFTADELALLVNDHGFRSVGLGPRILRAETAPVVAIAIVRALTRS